MGKLKEIYETMMGLNEDTSVDSSEVMLFMNTWGNYNVNGADADSIKGGWMTPDKALEWTKTMNDKGEEPFINDVDAQITIPFEITEYSNIEETVEMINDYCSLDEYDRNIIGAIIQATDMDYEDAKDTFEQGDFVFYEDVSNEYDLGMAEVDNCGSVIDAVGEDKIEYYLNEDNIFETWESDLRYDYAQAMEIDIDDIDEDDFREHSMQYIRDTIENAIADNNKDFFEDWFDYEAYGRDLSFDFTFTDYGAIYVY